MWKFIFIGLLGICTSANAQLSINAYYIKPSQFLGYIYAPTVGGVIGHSLTAIDSRTKVRFGIGYHILKPHESSYPDYGLTFLGNQKALPGYQTWSKMTCKTINLMLDGKLLSGRISPTLGMDLTGSTSKYTFNRVIPGVRNETSQEEPSAFTITPKLGLCIEQNEQWLFLISLGKDYTFDTKLGPVQFWRTSFGVVYYLNNY